MWGGAEGAGGKVAGVEGSGNCFARKPAVRMAFLALDELEGKKPKRT